MPKLVLIKHSLPDVRPEQPPSRWRLSPEGSRRALELAEALRPMGLERIFSSREAKAVQTAAFAGERLGLGFEVREGLHEHDREREPFASPEDFEVKVRELFRRPSERVFRSESAQEALARFSSAIDAVISEASGADIAVVAHGTVISLFVASKCGVDGFELWQRLGLPSYVVLETPGWRLVEVVEEVAAHEKPRAAEDAIASEDVTP